MVAPGELLAPRKLQLEREQALAYVALANEEMTAEQLARVLERYELICAQRGWLSPTEAERVAYPLLPVPPCLFA